MKTLYDIELVASDFDGIDPARVVCRGCNGPLCGDKTPKLYEGELIFVCHANGPGLKVLTNAAARQKATSAS